MQRLLPKYILKALKIVFLEEILNYFANDAFNTCIDSINSYTINSKILPEGKVRL